MAALSRERSVPMGSACVIWTGVGGVGTVIPGIRFFHAAVTFWRLLSLSLIFIGIVGLEMVHRPSPYCSVVPLNGALLFSGRSVCW